MTQATQQEDPWATASQAATSAAAPADKDADPFATPDSIGGGPRGPRWAEILDRLVVLKPIELLENQPIQGGETDPNKTQNIYVCDLTVLGPEPVTVFTPEVAKDGKTYPETSETFQTPYTWERWYAYGKGVEVKLTGAVKAGKPLLLGVVKRCPTGPGYRKGETTEMIAKRWDDYRAAIVAGRDVQKPQFSWGLVDATPEQTQVALAWWRGQ